MESEKEYRKKYWLGNNNRKKEWNSIQKTLKNSDLEDPELEYIEKRFLEALFALDSLAIRNKLLFQILRVTVMICGILIIAVVNLQDYLQHTTLYVTLLSVISSISFGILQLFRNDIMWAHHRLKFEAIRKEFHSYLNLSSETYQKSISHKESYKVFVAQVEHLFDVEIREYFSNLQIGSNVIEMLKIEKGNINSIK